MFYYYKVHWRASTKTLTLQILVYVDGPEKNHLHQTLLKNQEEGLENQNSQRKDKIMQYMKLIQIYIHVPHKVKSINFKNYNMIIVFVHI